MDDIKKYNVVDEDGAVIGSYSFRGNPQIGDVFDVIGGDFYIVGFVRKWINGYPTLLAKKVEHAG